MSPSSCVSDWVGIASQRGSSTYCPLTGTALACRGAPMQKPEATMVEAMRLQRLRRCMVFSRKLNGCDGFEVEVALPPWPATSEVRHGDESDACHRCRLRNGHAQDAG